MEKYKTVKAVSVNPLSHKLDENGQIILKEKQVMTKEYALSLIHSKRSNKR